MSALKRFDFDLDLLAECYCDMNPSRDGEYVKHADYATLLLAARKAEKALAEAGITLEALRDNGWLKDKRAVGPDCTRVAKQAHAALAELRAALGDAK